jgi:hypothetical protein
LSPCFRVWRHHDWPCCSEWGTQLALRLHNKRWYPIIFLVGSAVVVAAWFRFVPGHRPELLLSGVGAIGGFTYFFYRQHLDETKLFKELYVEFNARYDKLNDGLNTILVGRKEGELSESERELIFSYFNLCAEEYFFYKAGYIDQSVWQAWCRGMDVFFTHPRIRDLWDADCRANSYYGFRPGVSSAPK